MIPFDCISLTSASDVRYPFTFSYSALSIRVHPRSGLGKARPAAVAGHGTVVYKLRPAATADMAVRNPVRLGFRMLPPPQHPAGIRAEPTGAFPWNLLDCAAALLAERRRRSACRMPPAPAFDGIERQTGFCCDGSISFPGLLQAGDGLNLLVCHMMRLQSERVPLTSQWR